MATEFEVRCSYCPPTDPPLMRVTMPEGADEVAWRKAWKAATSGGGGGAPQFGKVQCGCCGGTYSLVDDGQDPESGGLVACENVTAPCIHSVSVTGGVVQGGTVVRVNGHGLDAPGLVVKFAGVPAIWQGTQSSTSIDVKTPRGCYKLNIMEGPMYKLILSNITGAFAVDEPIAFGAGGSAIIRKIAGPVCMVYMASPPEDVQALVNGNVSGSTTGATARVSAINLIQFIEGEAVLGALSNATGAVKSLSPLVIDQPTAAFAPQELVEGLVSGALVRLTGSPYSGTVDVTVENAHGQRADGSSVLPGGFTYS